MKKTKEEVLDEASRDAGWIDSVAAICNHGNIEVVYQAMDVYADQECAELRRQMSEPVDGDWKLVGHGYQIADTGDYGGHYEITNGKLSILTKNDDAEALQPIVNALNRSGCKFYQDDWYEHENDIMKLKISQMRRHIDELKAAKPDIIVPGFDEINEEAETWHHGNIFMDGAEWAINRIKELNTPHSS